MDTIKNFKYKKIENFLEINEINLLKDYCRIKHRINEDSFDIDPNLLTNNGDTYFYGDPLMESLLIQKIPLMEKICNLELFATYAFWRMYSKFATLQKHKDRESCEISVTVMIGSDRTSWPIFIENNSIELEPGDAVVYLGCEVEHWREEFQGDWHAQCFLHYVDKNGPFKHLSKDGRLLYGTQK